MKQVSVEDTYDVWYHRNIPLTIKLVASHLVAALTIEPATVELDLRPSISDLPSRAVSRNCEERLTIKSVIV